MATMVLLVDDDGRIRETLADILQDEGFEVAVADSGELAITVADLVKPDVCLVDVCMPGLDGIALSKRFVCERLPVLLMTAASNSRGKTAVAESGADGLVTKPFDLRALFEKLRKLAKVA